jgi:ankyrin repeat protein
LTRQTFDANECDVMMDMPAGYERVLTTLPLYRSTYVLVYRSDKPLTIKSLDDPILKDIKVGVYQHSGVREALRRHGVKRNTVIHHISYDADLVPEHQPAYQIQEMLNGRMDAVAIWGPFAGYYRAIKKAPVSLQPINLMEQEVALEFDMALGLRKGDVELKAAIEGALQKEKETIRQILTDYGVPLVQCETCLISGDLPAHGPYRGLYAKQDGVPSSVAPASQPVAATVSLATLEQWLETGADRNKELNNAVLGNDKARVQFLMEKGADANVRDAQGYPPIVNAARKSYVDMVRLLAEWKADLNVTDSDGWNALMFAAWRDDVQVIEALTDRSADLEVRNPAGLTPLCIAIQHGKTAAASTLIQAGANVNVKVGTAQYTPVMLAILAGSKDTVEALLKRGADVNAVNAGGVTALMIAAAKNAPEIASLLLGQGANPATHSEDGRTALGIAREHGNDSVIKLLERAAKVVDTSSPLATRDGR